ncbi:MAG: TPD domain-containing protein [Archaeoglobaceae archaeon]
MRIKVSDFVRIRRELRDVRDLNKFELPRGVLHSILLQKRVESVKRKYQVFANRVDEIVEFWKRERKFPRWLTLPPVMKVRLLLKGLGFSAKEINRALNDPYSCELGEVVWKAVTRDYVYSPVAARLQAARGRLGERLLEEFLESLGVYYRTERELRGEFSKTPDALFEEPVRINGVDVRWVESKALFGDPFVHEAYERRQYSHYRRLFGEGIVIYWLGCVEGVDAITFSETDVDASILLDMKLRVSIEEGGEPLKEALEVVERYAEGETEFACSGKAARILKNMGFEVIFVD